MKEKLKSIFKEFWNFGLPDIRPRNLILPLSTGKIVILNGPRRSGKTYLLYESIKNLIKKNISTKNIIYLSFDDERLDCRIEDLDLILDAHLELNPDIKVSDLNFFFDHIHKIKGWETFILRLYEQVSQNIYLSCHDSYIIEDASFDILKNNSLHLELFPLSWSEFCDLHQVNLADKSTINQAKVERHFNIYFKQGGLPELNFATARTHRSKLNEYVNHYLFKDLCEYHQINYSPYFKFLINELLQNTSTSVSIHKTFHNIKSQGFKCSKNGIYDIIEKLQRGYLFNTCLKYDQSFVKSENTGKKIYPVDHSLLDIYDFNNTDREKKLECLVYLEIRKKTDRIWHVNDYFKTDFIGKWRGKWHAIQVCWSLNDNETIKRELKNLTKTCQKLNINTGWIVTRSTNEELFIDDVNVKIVSVIHFLETHPLFSNI